jgi:hypothetical protein
MRVNLIWFHNKVFTKGGGNALKNLFTVWQSCSHKLILMTSRLHWLWYKINREQFIIAKVVEISRIYYHIICRSLTKVDYPQTGRTFLLLSHIITPSLTSPSSHILKRVHISIEFYSIHSFILFFWTKNRAKLKEHFWILLLFHNPFPLYIMGMQVG